MRACSKMLSASSKCSCSHSMSPRFEATALTMPGWACCFTRYCSTCLCNLSPCCLFLHRGYGTGQEALLPLMACLMCLQGLPYVPSRPALCAFKACLLCPQGMSCYPFTWQQGYEQLLHHCLSYGLHMSMHIALPS